MYCISTEIYRKSDYTNKPVHIYKQNKCENKNSKRSLSLKKHKTFYYNEEIDTRHILSYKKNYVKSINVNGMLKSYSKFLRILG